MEPYMQSPTASPIETVIEAFARGEAVILLDHP